jgi:dTDP-4-dehydrorhamnose 3,5-epimerase
LKISALSLEGLFLIETEVFADERGSFSTKYSQKLFEEIGIKNKFVQDNLSVSKPNVLRGLHYQTEPGQSKLVTVLTGTIYDVVVDCRPGSITFGKFETIILEARSPRLLLVPERLAHGYCVIGNEPATVFYKADSEWNQASEHGILWNDPSLNIPWPMKSPVLSLKDRQWPLLKY